MENKLRILVVEDKPLIAENLKLTLEDLGYEVVGPCYTFVDAVNQILRADIDLALLDINLGGRNKDENGIALGQLLAQTSQLPFVFLTAYNDLETIRTATNLGPGGYLIKPVNPATVFAAIQAAIQNSLHSKKASVKEKEDAPDYFFLKLGGRNHRILWSDVYCIAAGKNYVKLQIADGQMEYPIRGSITFVLEELLPEHLVHDFLRINRSECINRKYITAFDAQTVVCEGREFLNSRYTLKELQELLPSVK